MNKSAPIALVAAIGILTACTSRTFTLPDGSPIYKSHRFGNRESIKRVEYRSKDGSVFIMEGYGSDQVEAIAAGVEAGARGAVQGLMGGTTAKPMSASTAAVPDGFKLVPKDDPSKPQLEIP